LLDSKISAVDIEKVKADVIRFIPDGNRLAIWSTQYFRDLVKHLIVQ
jgi:hypothetical protein